MSMLIKKTDARLKQNMFCWCWNSFSCHIKNLSFGAFIPCHLNKLAHHQQDIFTTYFITYFMLCPLLALGTLPTLPLMTIFTHNSNSIHISFAWSSFHGHHIVINICTWHDGIPTIVLPSCHVQTFVAINFSDYEWELNVNGLVQERCNSIANALELRLSCTNPST